MKKNLLIIISYKNRFETIECIESIIEHSDCDKFDILVIDNAQSDAIRERNHFTVLGNNIYYIANIENLGFSAAVNQGAFWALQNGYDNIILANNDTRATSKAIDNLITACENEVNIDIIGFVPIICYYDKMDIVWSAGGYISRFGFRKSPNSGKNLSSSQSFNDLYTYATGCFILFRLLPFLNQGGYSEKFFFGEEDFNFSYKLKKIGGVYKLIKNSLIYHKVSGTILNDKSKIVNTIYLYYLNRFIDLKDLMGVYSLMAIWSCYIPYIFIFILSGKLSSGSRFNFLSKLISESLSLKGVSRDKFNQIMNGEH